MRAPNLSLMSKLLVTAATLALLPSCIIVNNGPRGGAGGPLPQQPAYSETPEPAQAPPPESPGLAVEGRPNELKPGAPEAYWVWHDAQGWHLRTTTARNAHRFTGRVWGVKGAVQAKAVRNELNDRFKHSGKAMTFDFYTQGHEDGFDFQIAEGNCAIFHLFVDGEARPGRIRLGAAGAAPPSATFKACHP